MTNESSNAKIGKIKSCYTKFKNTTKSELIFLFSKNNKKSQRSHCKHQRQQLKRQYCYIITFQFICHILYLVISFTENLMMQIVFNFIEFGIQAIALLITLKFLHVWPMSYLVVLLLMVSPTYMIENVLDDKNQTIKSEHLFRYEIGIFNVMVVLVNQPLWYSLIQCIALIGYSHIRYANEKEINDYSILFAALSGLCVMVLFLCFYLNRKTTQLLYTKKRQRKQRVKETQDQWNKICTFPVFIIKLNNYLDIENYTIEV